MGVTGEAVKRVTQGAGAVPWVGGGLVRRLVAGGLAREGARRAHPPAACLPARRATPAAQRPPLHPCGCTALWRSDSHRGRVVVYITGEWGLCRALAPCPGARLVCFCQLCCFSHLPSLG